jgi:hypothetical protein
MAGAAYQSCGGAIEGRHGPIPLPRAVALRAFFAAEAERQHLRGDSAAARFCDSLARELAAAITASLSWRRASGPV